MSTYIYLRCVTCKETAEQESGQHRYDIPQLREDIRSRFTIAYAHRLGMTFQYDRYRENTAAFFTEHVAHHLTIVDEYDDEYSTWIHAETDPL